MEVAFFRSIEDCALVLVYGFVACNLFDGMFCQGPVGCRGFLGVVFTVLPP